MYDQDDVVYPDFTISDPLKDGDIAPRRQKGR